MTHKTMKAEEKPPVLMRALKSFAGNMPGGPVNMAQGDVKEMHPDAAAEAERAGFAEKALRKRERIRTIR